MRVPAPSSRDQSGNEVNQPWIKIYSPAAMRRITTESISDDMLTPIARHAVAQFSGILRIMPVAPPDGSRLSCRACEITQAGPVDRSPAQRTFHMRATPFNALPLVLAALLATGIPASAEDGVSADKIVFGQATALEGPASALGQGMKMGLEAAFAEVNKAGGVKGRKLELKSVDDGYEPTKSIEAVKKLLEEDKVFAIAGAVGTPTSAATQPIATAAGAPFIGAFTGAEFLREPYKPLVMNIRASYFQETEAMVEHLTKDLGATKIAIMYQDDAFGQAGLAGVKKALDKRKMQLAGEGTFERNTVAVKTALLAIKKARASCGHHDQPLQARGRVHQAGQADQARRHLCEYLLRRFRRACQGARSVGCRRCDHAGRSVPERRRDPGRRTLPGLAQGDRPRRAAGLRLARGLPCRPRDHRGARKGQWRTRPGKP